MTILCYHAVQPGWTAPMSMEPEAFAEHAAWLAKRRTVVPLADAVNRLDAAGRLPGKGVVLTFDDGFSSLYEHAFPVLLRHRLPATVFLVGKPFAEPDTDVDWVDRPPQDRLTTLLPDEILEMQRHGVAFESHSYSHADLTTLSYADCVRDLRFSRELLESLLGQPVRLLAYPRGRHNADVRAAAERAGYSHAFALPERREEAGRFAVPRVGVYHGNTVGRLRVKLSRPYLAIRTSRAAQLPKQLVQAGGLR
jgi:peptidoglycan/xylan/chitin deacetylase (PgdA/CDA1 family)